MKRCERECLDYDAQACSRTTCTIIKSVLRKERMDENLYHNTCEMFFYGIAGI